MFSLAIPPEKSVTILMSKPRRTYRAVLTIAQAAVAKGINNPYKLYEKTGIPYPRAKRLWDGEEKLDLKDISILINRLPCSLKDLINTQPVSDEESLSKMPAAVPKRRQPK